MIFADRQEAGRALAKSLNAYAGREDTIVLALPRGGVPVAYEVARALNSPLDVFVVRKLGMPGHEEFAVGAIASGGVRVVNPSVQVDPAVLDGIEARERPELLRRERVYRGERPLPSMAGKVVIVIDDGLATGSTLRAALQALRKFGPRRLVAAVPVGAEDACEELRDDADEVVCLHTPTPFSGVGRWYRNFDQTSDEQVRELLGRAAQIAAPRKAGGASSNPPDDGTLAALRRCAMPLDSFDALLDRIGGARLVLIGEASHGTHEFYDLRARLTKRLIEEKGYSAVAVEADWPDAYRVNRFVRGSRTDADANAALSGFVRFPTWMWRNTVVSGFVAWLRDHNSRLADSAGEVGFYGLDLYSLRGSIEAVLAYLRENDPEAAQRAQRRYACFDHFGEDVQAYGYAASLGLGRSCEDAVVSQLVELLSRANRESRRDDELFSAERNAKLVANAEAYYRSMFAGRAESWNLRDTHMMDTLQSLMKLSTDSRPMKAVVWAHNSHLGDARATDMARRGEINLGQLVRETYADDAVLVGFSTYAGEVTAASDWDEPARRRQVRPGLPGSFETLFHQVGSNGFQLDLSEPALAEPLTPERLQRAIGVVYRPQTERLSHYLRASMARQFDWMIHIDRTSALLPLEPGEGWRSGEPPETYPSSL